MKNICKTFLNVFYSMLEVFFMALPNSLSKYRIKYLRLKGVLISPTAFIARNVYFVGKIKIGENSSISNNCFLNGVNSGIEIGDNVMIAPGCVLVAFEHGTDLGVSMLKQGIIEEKIVIENDVWIAANCTITKGVHLHQGCIVGANSVVTKSVDAFDIVGGVPARKIGSRLTRTSR